MVTFEDILAVQGHNDRYSTLKKQKPPDRNSQHIVVQMSKDGSSGAKDYEIKAGSLENQFSSVFNSRAAGTPLLADSRHSVLDVLTPPLISIE